MPTTLTLDDELARLLTAAAQQKGQPMTEVAATLLRAALGKPAPAPAPVPAPTEPYRIHPHHGTFAPGIPLRKLNRLADELDTEAFLARQAS